MAWRSPWRPCGGARRRSRHLARVTREELPASEAANPKVAALLERPGRKARFSAAASGSAAVAQGGRGIAEYMALPPTEYSVLDAEKVERVDDDTFRCSLAQLNFLGFKVEPVLTAVVDVRPEGAGPVISIVAAELRGLPSADSRFEITSTNCVSWAPAEGEPGSVEISSETEVNVYVAVPAYFPFSVASLERTGNFVVRQVVNQVVPRFLAQLAEDYVAWSEGDDSREARSSGQGLFDVEVDEPTDELKQVAADDKRVLAREER